MTLLEKLKLMRELRRDTYEEAPALVTVYKNHPIHVTWKELISELEMLELYRAHATMKASENEEY